MFKAEKFSAENWIGLMDEAEQNLGFVWHTTMVSVCGIRSTPSGIQKIWDLKRYLWRNR